MRLRLLCPIAGLLLSCGGVAQAAVIADFVTDFSITANPNGAWAYGTTTSLGGGLTLLTNPLDASGGGDIRYDWNPGPRTPLVGVLIPGSGSPAGILHPGAGGEMATARYTVQTSFTGFLDVAFMDGSQFATTDVHVARTGVSLFDAAIDPSNALRTFQATLTLQTGDTLDFVAGWGADSAINFDTTTFTAVLSEATLPEPGSMAMLALGVLGLTALRRRP